MIPQQDFLERLGVAAGVPFEPDALSTRITSYIDTRRARGYYQARVTPAVSFADDDRVANLTLTVAPGPHVSVVFTGDPLPGATRTALVPIEREGSADEDLLEDSSNRIEEFLRAQGYRDATAPHTRQETDGELLITFDVHKGPQYRVGSVEISGDASLPLPDLRSSLRTRVGEAYSDANLDADVTAIESVYRGRGFAAARVQADPRPGAATSDGTQIPVAVSILITEGVRTVVGAVRIEGNASVPEAALRRNPQPPAGRAVLRRAAPTRYRRHSAAVRESGVPVGDGAGAAGVYRGSRAGESRVHRPRGSTDLRRSRADRRQRADERADDRARAAAEAGRSAQPRGRVRESAPACGAAALSPRARNSRNCATATRRGAICS